MGKLERERSSGTQTSCRARDACVDESAPICQCCSITKPDVLPSKAGEHLEKSKHDTDIIKELVIIGAGPHALSLVLRLIEQDPDLMTDKERHMRAEHVTRLRPIQEVRSHVSKIAKSASSLRQRTPKTSVKNATERKEPKVSLHTNIESGQLLRSIMVLDRAALPSRVTTGWLSQWKQNFYAIQIPVLRSPIHAHADPFDHRSLEFFAEVAGRLDELVPLPYLRQRDAYFRGPYQAPSTSLFLDFHKQLIQTYGIEDMVQSAIEVDSIVPKSGLDTLDQKPYFELHGRWVSSGERSRCTQDTETESPLVVKTRRVVCAMGPMFQTGEAFWETSLRLKYGHDWPSKRILHSHEIVPWLLRHKGGERLQLSLLIVGGGITGVHMTLLAAKENWCMSVTLIQRSKMKERQFDLDNKWMGPERGKLLDNFWALNAHSRAKALREARQGGSVPPEYVRRLVELSRTGLKPVQIKEEVQISDVAWSGSNFEVQLDDGSPPESFDMIWLATGADNDIELYPPLVKVQEHLPVQIVEGLPILNSDLSWKKGDTAQSEPQWKELLRRRLFVMGSLAALELGPDALNLLGARQGAVRVAKVLRSDMKLWRSATDSSSELGPSAE